MNRRAFFVALGVAAIGVLLLLAYVRRFEQEASGGQKIQLLTLVKTLERGMPVTDDTLAVRAIPQAYVEDRAVKASEKERILGLRVNNRLEAQETLMWTDIIASSDERRDLSSLVQPGNRAVTIRLSNNSEDTVGLIRPGDFVDVLGIFGDKENRTASVLLQRVLVLATGNETSSERNTAAAPKRVSTMSLSLSLQESQLLEVAIARGQLDVVLRNPDDQRIADHTPDINSSVLSDSNARESIRGIRKNMPTNKPQVAGTP